MINKTRLRGITLLEIFVALGALSVVLTFAAAPLQRMSARVDVDIAHDNIVYTLKTANQAATRAGVPVRVIFASNGETRRLEAGFSSRRGVVDFSYLPHYRLPEHVLVSFTEGMSEIEFLPTGTASQTGLITLTSTRHPDYVVKIRISHVPTPRGPASP